MTKGKGWIAVVLTAAIVWALSNTVNLAQNASSSGAAGSQVACVNLVHIFDNFEQTKVLNQKRLEDMKELDQVRQEKAKDIQAEKDALEAYSPDSAEYFKRSKKLKKMQYDFEVWKRLEQDRIAEAYLHWYRKTYKMMMQEIEQVAKKRGVDLVVTQEDLNLREAQDVKSLIQQIFLRKVVYNSPRVDLTEQVLSNLNAEFAKAGGADSVEFSR
jgi:Skp family chaperone for outer membrane proteins